jgi:hypothetical protein
MKNNYPDSVQEFANKAYNALENIDFFTKIFGFKLSEEQEQKCFDLLCENRLSKFINGEPLEFASNEEANNTINSIVGSITIDLLKEKGVVDSIEDENGKEVFFLTTKGKEYAQKFEYEINQLNNKLNQ